MSKSTQSTNAHQNFILVKCVIPHDRTKENYVFLMTDKVTSTYSVCNVKVSSIINDTPKPLQTMPISVGTNATEQAIVEYIAIPKVAFKETWEMMKDWAKLGYTSSFMSMFWKLCFVEAVDQLAEANAPKGGLTVIGLPMEMFTEDLMKEIFEGE